MPNLTAKPILVSAIALLLLALTTTAAAEGEERKSIVLASQDSLENLAGDIPEVGNADAVSVPVSRILLAMARLMRPNDATMDQTIAAIVRHNPEVFPTGDLESVTITRPLKTPSPDQVRSEEPGSLQKLVDELNRGAVVTEESLVASATPSLAEEQPQAESATDKAPESASEKSGIEEQAAGPAAPGTDDQASGEETSTFSTAFWVGVVIAVLLILLLLILVRQSKNAGQRQQDRRDKDRFTESSQATAVSVSVPEQAEGAASTKATPEESARNALAMEIETLLSKSNVNLVYKRFDEAFSYAVQAVRKSPSSPIARLQLMKVLQERGDKEGFQEEYERLYSAGFGSQHEDIWRQIGQLGSRLGLELQDEYETEEGSVPAAEFMGSSKINEQDIKQLLSKADINLIYGKTSQARGLIEQALELDPDDPGAKTQMVRLLLQEEDDTAAQDELDKLKSSGFPEKHPEEWNEIGKLQRKHAEALRKREEEEEEEAGEPDSAGPEYLDESVEPEQVDVDEIELEVDEDEREAFGEAARQRKGERLDSMQRGSDSVLDERTRAELLEEVVDDNSHVLTAGELLDAEESQPPQIEKMREKIRRARAAALAGTAELSDQDREAEARRESEAEEQHLEIEEQIRKQAEEKAEAEEQARLEAEEKARAEAEEKKQKEAEARAKAEAEETKRKEAEAKAKAEAEEKKQEEKKQKEADARAKAEAEEKKRKDAEARAKAEAEEKKRKEAEARAKAEAEEKKRKAAEAKARAEAEERAREEAEARAKAEAEERARKEEQERMRRQEELARELLMASQGPGATTGPVAKESGANLGLPAEYQMLLGDVGDAGSVDSVETTQGVENYDSAAASLRMARSYLDMGELDMAKRLLTEVVQTGNSSQQAAAKALIEKADS